MDENSSTTQTDTTVSSDTQNFKTVRHNEGKGKKPLLLILIILGLLVLIIGLFLFLKGRAGQSEATPTPGASLEVLETIEPEPTSTAEPVDKENISVEILNGTGIAKEASYMEGVLKQMGYEKIELGNASTQNYEDTEVTFPTNLPDSEVEEITDKLESIYKTVKTKTSESSEKIVIITGLRKGATIPPKATATPTSKPSATQTPTTTPTSSPTATPTPTPS